MVSSSRATDLTIRPYESDRDAARIREIVGEIWSGGADAILEREYGVSGDRPWCYWQAQDVLGYIGAAGARSFVAELGGAPIGFCSYTVDHARSRATIGYNGVARANQGRGIGTAMMDFVMERIRGEGLEFAIVLVADNEEHIPALRNYERHGFRRFAGYHQMICKL